LEACPNRFVYGTWPDSRGVKDNADAGTETSVIVAQMIQQNGVKPGLSFVDQSLPIKNRITRIRTIRPTPPLGLYPHDRLCGQTGINPRSTSIKIISKIVPIDIFHPLLKIVAKP
jgi:hypothetical protein